MGIFSSPGVFTREHDLSALPSNLSPILPAFVGTAKRGPLNEPKFITSAEQFVQNFGEPFAESSLGYAVIAYLEEGNAAWVLRVGVECESGQVTALSDVCIDTSGNKIEGWGRIPVFSGIDFGKICLRVPTVDDPYEFHEDEISNILFADVAVSGAGTTVATLDFTGVGLSDTYTGVIDDSFSLLIITGPSASSGSVMDGATYEIIRNSDGKVIATGTIVESGILGTSDPIAVGSGDDDTGLILAIVVTGSSPLEDDDVFSFTVRPNNLTFDFEVEGDSSLAAFSFVDGDSYSDVDSFVTDFNALLSSTATGDFIAVNSNGVPCIRTVTAGERIQLALTEAWALEVGISKWVYDIPRSHFIGNDVGTYTITSSNNRVAIRVAGATETVDLEVTIPTSSVADPDDIAAALNLGGSSGGETYYESFALQYTDDDKKVVVVTSVDHGFDQVSLLADFSHIKTLRFSEALNVSFPYSTAYRLFADSRVELPAPGVVTPATPLSCEVDPASDDCLQDTAYFANIVGFLVASSPGTWLNDWSVSLVPFGTTPGRFEVQIYDENGVIIDRVTDISFDSRENRYIANLINPGTNFGGVDGNLHLHWEERPSYLDNDNTVSGFTPRVPGQLNRKAFSGMANGIPEDASLSSELDSAIIGNPATGTGIYSFDDPDRFDISLLAIPGNSSGSVIAAGLQFCERRGDCLYVVDPPFGLRPQQVVDWHNGILLSDLTNSLNSSYGALYYSWIKVFDQFNGGEIFIPPSGHVMSVFARTARVAEQWFAPAGLNRGKLITALDIEYNPTIGERDLLYGFNNAVNPLVNFFQDGITVWGQRTLQRLDSALDRVNVRMLLIFLKKALTRLCRRFIFEPNDEFLWAQVKNIINPFLGDIASRRGLTAFKTIVDETNNTPERIDRSELWISILLKPTRAAEFVVLNLAVLRTDAGFSAEEILVAAGVTV